MGFFMQCAVGKVSMIVQTVMVVGNVVVVLLVEIILMEVQNEVVIEGEAIMEELLKRISTSYGELIG